MKIKIKNIENLTFYDVIMTVIYLQLLANKNTIYHTFDSKVNVIQEINFFFF